MQHGKVISYASRQLKFYEKNYPTHDLMFVDRFSSILSPLKDLTQKKVRFEWLESCEKGFQELKIKLTPAPVLTLSRVMKALWGMVMHPEWA